MAALALILIAALIVGAGQFGLLAGSVPKHLGVENGRLQPPSSTPNSVSSQANLYPGHLQQAYAAMPALQYRGDGEAAMQKLEAVLKQYPRTVIVTRRPDYIYAQCSTPLLKFTDDVEFWLDKDAHAIQFRSASRLGRKDLGTNRARMEAIRARFEG
ncbi:MAG: DUF1499 domain-containing protein [Burkholderiaceae bacterium]